MNRQAAKVAKETREEMEAATGLPGRMDDMESARTRHVRLLLTFFCWVAAVLVSLAATDEMSWPTDRDFVYWTQKYVLWPLGIRLTQSQWHAAFEWVPLTLRLAALIVASSAIAMMLRRFAMPRLLSAICIPRGNRCAKCQYDLTANQSGVCPECGAIISIMPDEDVSQGRFLLILLLCCGSLLLLLWILLGPRTY